MLYGDGAKQTNEQLEAMVGGIEMNAVLGNAVDIMRRQHLLNPTDYMSEYKTPNSGK